MNRPLSLAAAVALTLALAACEEAPQSRLVDMRVPGTLGFAQFATTTGPMYVETNGTPFAGGIALDGAAFARQIAGAFAVPTLRFTTDKAAAPQSDHRLVWVFDPPEAFKLESLCAGPVAGGVVRKADIVQVTAAFCHEAKLYAVARGSVRRPRSADDQAWQQLVQQIARHLISERAAN
ncbi:MAG: hypothetical protein JNK67_23565 [Alphaproteobacteria bacterium]|nr:hypothetical protein [Alphaproteobacteria bacterium]